MTLTIRRGATALALVIALAAPAAAQWTHRYGQVDDFGHQIYLEQHELPILAGGVTDPAPAPDGRRLAFAQEGWIWILDLETGAAERITRGPGVDSRPRWSADGSRITFVRDTGSDTAVIVRTLSSGAETVINTPAIELDPEFSADGAYLFYTSGESGSLSVMRRHLASGADERLTDLNQVERNARRLPGGTGLMYLAGNGAARVLRVRDFLNGGDSVVHTETLTYHLTADVHPEERVIVYSAPIDNDYHLWVSDLDQPDVHHRLTEGNPYALTPAFSADGNTIFYTEADANRVFQLRRIATHGGAPETIEITSRDYGEATGTLSLQVAGADGSPLTARVAIAREDGHPVANPGGATYFDGQTGRHYFYVEGGAELTLPAGRYTVLAAHGPMAPVVRTEIRVRGGQTADAAFSLAPIWDAGEQGYVSADHHVHLNGDGHHRAAHGDALVVTAGEDLDLLAPMSWNRWERRIDAALVGEITTGPDGTIIDQGQEIRSHFHGHVGLVGVRTPYAPWFWGPTNPVLGDPDLTNGDVFVHADQTGAFATYVHPISGDGDPFENPASIPLELAADAVLNDRMGLELVCAWTSPLGNSQLWYRLLNIGRPAAAMSGTDTWVDFHRTPAMGTGRNYLRVHEGEPVTADAILAAAEAGRGFVTTGPALVFTLGDGSRPGDVTEAGPAEWRIDLTSTVGVDVVEIVVNGQVVETLDGVAAGESRTLTGTVELPQGGWVAARAYASERRDDSWPSMHARPFAHASPIWIGAVGSTEPGARAAAAADLITAIDASEARARAAYGERDMSRMYGRFDAARARLRVMTGEAE